MLTSCCKLSYPLACGSNDPWPHSVTDQWLGRQVSRSKSSATFILISVLKGKDSANVWNLSHGPLLPPLLSSAWWKLWPGTAKKMGQPFSLVHSQEQQYFSGSNRSSTFLMPLPVLCTAKAKSQEREAKRWGPPFPPSSHLVGQRLYLRWDRLRTVGTQLPSYQLACRWKVPSWEKPAEIRGYHPFPVLCLQSKVSLWKKQATVQSGGIGIVPKKKGRPSEQGAAKISPKKVISFGTECEVQGCSQKQQRSWWSAIKRKQVAPSEQHAKPYAS